MKLRIWCVSCYIDSLEPLIHKWKLERTPIDNEFDKDSTYAKYTGNYFEYWIEINTLEELFALQKDLHKEKGFGNELILSEWEARCWDKEKQEYKLLDKGIGIKVYNDYME